MSVNDNESKGNDDTVDKLRESIPECNEKIVDNGSETEVNLSEEMNRDLFSDDSSESESNESIVSENDKNNEKTGFLSKYSKKTLIIACSLAAFLLGILIGRFSQPKGRLDSVLITESASAEDSGKEYTQIVTSMDNAKHVVEERYYKADGSPAACETGYSIMRKSYDKNGNLVRTAYFDQNDKPYLVEKLGYSYVEMAYDESNHKTGETYYDTAGNVVILDGKNYAGVQYEYDENGNVLSAAYFDTDGNAVLSGDGYHKAQYTYDRDKHKLTERYYDTNGQLMIIPKGYAGIDHEYDDYGNDIRCAYYNADGVIAPNKDGTIISVKEYDSRGRVIREEGGNYSVNRGVKARDITGVGQQDACQDAREFL